jgi:hypothetical protein
LAALRRFPAPTIVTIERDLTPYPESLEPAYRVEVAVTDVRPGNGLLRYVIGYYAGATLMQAEFRLREAHSNRLVAAFATRRLHPGNANMGWGLSALSSKRSLESLGGEVAADLVALIQSILSEPLAARQNP